MNGLRSYGSEPQIWGGKENCKHKWGKEIIATNSGGGWFDPEKRDQYENQRLKNPKKEKQDQVSQGNICTKCGAWKGELGLEPQYYCGVDTNLWKIRDDLTEEERKYVLLELNKAGLL